jgi:predicted oxidoreductase
VIRARRGGGAPAPVRAFMEKGADFIVERNLADLVRRMNKLAGEELLDAGAVERVVRARDREIDTPSPRTRRSQPSAARATTWATS